MPKRKPKTKQIFPKVQNSFQKLKVFRNQSWLYSHQGANETWRMIAEIRIKSKRLGKSLAPYLKDEQTLLLAICGYALIALALYAHVLPSRFHEV